MDPSKPKEFADDNIRLEKNGRKFSKRVENTVGKGEIVFKRLLLQTRKNQGLFGKGLKSSHITGQKIVLFLNMWIQALGATEGTLAARMDEDHTQCDILPCRVKMTLT